MMAVTANFLIIIGSFCSKEDSDFATHLLHDQEMTRCVGLRGETGRKLPCAHALRVSAVTEEDRLRTPMTTTHRFLCGRHPNGLIQKRWLGKEKMIKKK